MIVFLLTGHNKIIQFVSFNERQRFKIIIWILATFKTGFRVLFTYTKWVRKYKGTFLKICKYAQKDFLSNEYNKVKTFFFNLGPAKRDP